MRGPLRIARVVAPIIVIAITTSACGSGSDSDSRGGDQPITARSLAAVVDEHLSGQVGNATSARPELDGPRAVGGVGAEVRFRAKGEFTGPSVSVSVGTKAGPDTLTCSGMDKNSYSGCVATDGGVLFWEKAAPDEDPGVVYVALRKGKATVLMFQSGPAITQDPRKLDLRISVKDMFAIAKDPKVNVTTSAEAIRAGQRLKSWRDRP